MKKLFKIFTFVFVLSFIFGMNLSAQDQPTSIGPAPINNSIDRIPFVQEPVTFPDLLAGPGYGGKHIPAPINLVSIPVPAGTPFTPVGAPYTTLLQGGDFGAGGIFYATRSPSTLITINTTTGVQTVLGAITGTSGTITAMGYHPGSNTMYLGTTTVTISRLYTLNTTTRVATLVGTVTNCNGLIAIGVNCAGEIYGVDIVGDNAVKINPTTGAGTVLGPLGFNANYAQDADFEFASNTLYLAAYPGSWRTMNLTTGMTTLITSWPSTEVTALGIVGDCGPTGCNFIAGSWCPAGTLPNLPATTLYAASAWLGDTLYVQTPTSSSATTTVRRYTWGGSWTTGVPLPSAKRYGAMTECNGKLYFIGGGTSSSGGNATYEYDAGTGAWTTKANLPISRGGHGLVNWGDSVIFCVGGPWSSTPSTGRHVYYYRVGSDTWGTLTNSLPTAATRRAFSIGLIENKIIIAAGYQSGGLAFLKSTYIGTIGSDATSLTWAAGPNVPTPYTGLSRSGGTAYGDFFFVVGGEKGGPGGSNNVTYVYSASSNTYFDSIQPMAHANHNISNVVTAKCIDDTVRLFVPGGYCSPSPGYLNTLDVTGCGPVLTHFKNITQAPKGYNLNQNYPNPFNPTTKISYSIPKTGLVTLQVYDILGKEIATLVNEVKNTGSYIVEFNGSNLSSGIYFYRLQSEDFVAVKKMMFIK